MWNYWDVKILLVKTLDWLWPPSSKIILQIIREPWVYVYVWLLSALEQERHWANNSRALTDFHRKFSLDHILSFTWQSMKFGSNVLSVSMSLILSWTSLLKSCIQNTSKIALMSFSIWNAKRFQYWCLGKTVYFIFSRKFVYIFILFFQCLWNQTGIKKLQNFVSS